MQLEVYDSDAEALAGAAEEAETVLAASAIAHPALGVSGGRGGRAIMVALAARSGIPWTRIRATVADEVCVPPSDARSNRRLLAENLLAPRGLASLGPLDGAAPDEAWEAEVRAVAGPDVTFDLLVLELGPQGELGPLVPGGANGEATIVRATDASATPPIAHVGLGPGALVRARRVFVLALGAARRDALGQAVRGDDPTLPARAVVPSARVTWFVDRAAAADLLRDARPART